MDEQRRNRASDDQSWMSLELTSVEEYARHIIVNGQARGGVVASECPPGPEFRVTTLTQNGMHQIVGITDGRDHAEPELSDAAAANLRSVVRTLLDLLGQEAGSARMTVVLTPRGPRIVEYERGPTDV